MTAQIVGLVGRDCQQSGRIHPKGNGEGIGMLQSASGGLKPAVLSGVIWGECTGTLLESDAEGPHEHLAFDSGEMEIETVAKGVRDLTGAGMV